MLLQYNIAIGDVTTIERCNMICYYNRTLQYDILQ